MAIGFVYVLTNRSMPGCVKIGYTLDDVENRAKDISSATGVPQAFEVEFRCLTLNPDAVERIVHDALNSKRVSDTREFFKVDVDEAVRIVKGSAIVPQLEYRKPRRLGERRSTQGCRRCGFEYQRSDDVRFCPKCGF